jgi:hypothetical protein
VVELGFTEIVAEDEPLLHKYDVPPDAFRIAGCPWQIV